MSLDDFAFADFIIKSDAVYTGVAEAPEKACLAVKGDRIIAVCGEDGIARYTGEQTKVYSYGNNLVMAGFVDAHTHFCMGSALLGECFVDLTASKSAEDCVSLIKGHLEKHPDIDHILGWGWFVTNWDPPVNPDKRILDSHFPDIPLYLSSVDGHTTWVNTKALEVCGITAETAVAYGEVQKDANGDLTGLLLESDAQTKPNENAFECKDEDYEKMLDSIAGYGITSVTDLSIPPKLKEEPRGFGRLLNLHNRGRLTARIHLYPSLGDDGDFTVAKQIREKYQYPDLMFCGLKQFADGTTSQYTSPFLEPYSDRPDLLGQGYYPPEFFMDIIPKANKEGFSIKIHAIGDKAVRTILDAYEASGKENDLRGIRNCVEHIESIHPSDIKRFKELGVIASVQPTHLPLDANEKTQRIGKERARYEWAFRSLLDSGAVLAFGTDNPVYMLDPMHGIHAAVTRAFLDGTPVGSSPEEKITLKEALDAYTKGGAYSLKREHEIGTLEEGKLADIVVLSGNLFDLAPQEYLKVTPLMTIMGGKVVYSK